MAFKSVWKFTGWILIFSIVYISACNQAPKPSLKGEPLFTPKYAKWFSVQVFGNDTALILLHPANNGNNDTLWFSFAKNANFTTLSASHGAFIDAIKASNQIDAVDHCKYYATASIANACNNHAIQEIGEVSGINAEVFVNMQPQIITISGFDKKPTWSVLAEKAGSKVVRIWEWREKTALARAEWVIAFGYLAGKANLAQQFFKAEEATYTSVLNQVADTTLNAFSGNAYQGVWYCPGGKSYLAQMLNQAGYNYHFKDNEDVGSLSITEERAFEILNSSDLWIYHGMCNTLDCMYHESSRLQSIPTEIVQHIWSPNKTLQASGANLFWEKGVVSPSWVLSDLINIARNDTSNLHFYQLLK